MTQDLLFEKDDVRITRHVAYFADLVSDRLYRQRSHRLHDQGQPPGDRRGRGRLCGARLRLPRAAAGRGDCRRRDPAGGGAPATGVAETTVLLIFKTSGGDVDAFISRKRDLVTKAKEAIESAFRARGG